MPKISELDLASALNVSNDDLLVLVDHETSSTRKIKVIELAAVIANILDIPLKKNVGEDLLTSYPLPRNRTLGTEVSVNGMSSTKLVDNYSVSEDSGQYTFTYTTHSLPNRFIVVAETPHIQNSVYNTVLFDTSAEITGSSTVTLCKPAGATKIKVYISSKTQSSFVYTLSDNETDCVIAVTSIPSSPTPTETPIVTPTPSPTAVDDGWIEATPTVTPTITTTPSVTPSNTPTNTPTISLSATTTPTATVTPSSGIA